MSAVAFVSVLIIVIALVIAIYAIFQIVAPGVFGETGRIPVLRHPLEACYVALASSVILWRHLKLVMPQLWSRRVAPSTEVPTSPTSL